MWKNYLKTSFRNLRRQKGYTLINILGLTSGIVASIFIFLWILDELSFDKFHIESDRIYSVMVNSERPDGIIDTYPANPSRLKETLVNEIPEIELATQYSFESAVLVKHKAEGFNEIGIYADPNFFRVFSFPLVKGSVDNIQNKLNSVYISEDLAKKLFKDETSLEKTILLGQDQELTVAGVFKNIPDNSSLQFDFVAPFDLYLQENPWMQNWASGGSRTTVLLSENSEIPTDKIANLIQKNCTECTSQPFLYPYHKLRLHGEFENGVNIGGRIQQIYLFGIVAIVILIMACINFINLATARSGSRGREVGIRKSIGANKSELVIQFITESILVSWIALILAILLVQLLLPFFNQLTGKNLALDLTNPIFLLGLVSITIITGVLSGAYPAFILSRFKPISVLKGDNKSILKGQTLRRILVIAQFSTSAILIVGSIAIYQQINFISNRNLGFNKENILLIDQNEGIVKSYEGIKNELLQLPGIENIAFGGNSIFTVPITTNDPVWTGKPENSNINFKIYRCDEAFIPTLNIPISNGRNFLGAQDASNYIINKKAVEAMGLDLETAVGTELEMWHGKGQIIGVSEDFHNDNLKFDIEPMIFMFSENLGSHYFIKVSNQASKAGLIDQVKGVFKKYNPEYPFEFSFLEEVFEREYQNEQVIGKLALSFTIIAILISGLGLFGLASFTAERRTKEIGIRKVLGASSKSLSLLLCSDFAILVFASLLIGFPIAWYVIREFLSNFTFHTEIHWTLFFFTGMLMLGLTLLSVGYHAIKTAWSNPVNSLQNEE
ncbi:ABC transporter permease [Algoriphagus winogradskyi]|uniref:ABC-type transport system, involved in lipoprotein release, permease component n=1 Tax=Algoriphagus winogradskyi TaxID=237017 RepID=A0ABY1NYB3_9BACT|nr:ABC transporter permease [Algoriphagus winogradskyi]SMP20728.1 ABC-type transport system, involved in lipoprotein release, permease component [Algoriphagus winogradskyi]